PNEFALFAYPRDIDNYLLKQAENHYLSKAFAENSLIDLEQFVVLRRARGRIIGTDALRQEMLSETNEGMAEYAGLMALNQLARQKFVEDADKHLEHLRDTETLQKPRLISYSVGCMICLAMKSIGIDFHHNLSDSRPLFEFVPQSISDVEKHFETYSKELQDKFAAHHENSREKIVCNAEITGFNPMGMTRLGDEILCDQFVMLSGDYIEGPVLLVMEDGSLDKVAAYIR
ncbi:MAG: hypothetical protein FWC67_04515, partial [Defluviitaleaceae bacterium]|nr:hypothetical protein [Defluviitaleaceae bacterium]